MKSLKIILAAVQNQPADARRQYYPKGVYPFWQHQTPGPTTYQGFTDDEDRPMKVGVSRFYTSQNKDRSRHKFINNQPSSPDPCTPLPQHVMEVLYGSQILRLPTPGDPNEYVFDSLMQRIKENEEKRGYSIRSRNPKKRIDRGNQISKRDIRFAKAMVEIISVEVFCNDRGPMSNCSERWKTQSANDAINLLAIQNCFIKHLWQVMPDTVRRVFPGETKWYDLSW